MTNKTELGDALRRKQITQKLSKLEIGDDVSLQISGIPEARFTAYAGTMNGGKETTYLFADKKELAVFGGPVLWNYQATALQIRDVIFKPIRIVAGSFAHLGFDQYHNNYPQLNAAFDLARARTQVQELKK